MNSSDKFKNKPWQGYFRTAIMVISITHFIGILGLNSASYHSIFEKIASLNMFLSFILVMSFHRPFDSRFLIFCGCAFIAGMTSEVIGVRTGYIFGSYYYTQAFGCQVMGVPLSIGINWLLLSYSNAVLVAGYFRKFTSRVITAAALMVLIDLLLEPFAIKHHFWVWNSSTPPLQNYISWFLVSIIIQIAYIKLIPDTLNKSAGYYLLILLLFLSMDFLLSFFLTY
jgi:uncharacterized membrane protein